MSDQTRNGLEYRITGSPDGGYWSGILGRTWSDEDAANAAFREYRGRVDADHFISERHRRAHLSAVHIEVRTVTPWLPLDSRIGGHDA